MSGICGWIGGGLSRDLADAALSQMEDALPRGEKKWKDEISPTCAVFLTSSTEELISFSDQKIRVVINGSPQWRDCEFTSYAQNHGSAAALAQAYQKYGQDCLRYLYGSFSLAILLPDQETALLAVDQMGILPLCYSRTKTGELVFGSTARTVHCHPSINTSISSQAIFDYIYFHYVPSPITIYSDIRKLEPAQMLIYKDGDIKLSYYWQPNFIENTQESFSSLKIKLESALQTSILHCNPDGKTGTFLSGGLDSSTVSGVLAGISKERINSYSIGFSAGGYDEIGFARIASSHFNTQLHEYYVTPEDIIDAIPVVARAYDEPFGNSSAIPTLYCARLAYNNGTRVMLAGDGGDELFAGNTRYAKQKIFNAYWSIPNFIRNMVLEPLFIRSNIKTNNPLSRKIKSYIEQASVPMPDRMESYNFLQRNLLEEIFLPDFIDTINPQHPIELLQHTYHCAPADSLVNKMLWLDWKFTLADNDLRKVNRMCEIAGIKVHYPLLDHEVVQLSTQIPPSLKLKGLKLRYFYKKALNGFLPSEVINKSKHGFGLPFGEWLKTSPKLQELIYARLQNLKLRGIFRPEFIDHLIEMHRHGHAAYYGTMVWVLAMLEEWMQQHNDE